MGCRGWAYRDVLPYFRRAEGNERFASEFHGTEGPLGVSDQRHTHKLSKAFVQACQQYGMTYNADFNGSDQAGTGLYQVTNRNGRRCSAAVAYLGVARRRPNLSIRTGVVVRRILFENTRAVGVEAAAGRESFSAFADQEIVLAAGAINSPKLLILSGIGSAAHLSHLGITVQADLEGVGQNLRDHLDIFMMYNVRGCESHDAYKRVYRQIGVGLQYAIYRNGPLSATVVEAGAFWPTESNNPETDVQLHFLAGTGIEAVTGGNSSGNGCTLNAYCCVRARTALSH